MAFVDLDFEPKEARGHLYGWRIPQAIHAYTELLEKATNELEIAYFQQRLAQALFRTFDHEKALSLHCSLKPPAGDAETWDVEWQVVWLAYCAAESARGSRWRGRGSLNRAETAQRLIERVKAPSADLVFEYVLAIVGEAGRMNSGPQAFENEVSKARLAMRLVRDAAALPLDDIEATIADERFMKAWEPRKLDATVVTMAEANPDIPYWRWTLAMMHQQLGRGNFTDKVGSLGLAFELSEALAEEYPEVIRFQRTRAEVAGLYAEALGERDPKRSAEVYRTTGKKIEELAARHPYHPAAWEILQTFHYNFCTWRSHRLENVADSRQRALEEQLDPGMTQDEMVPNTRPKGFGFEVTVLLEPDRPQAPFGEAAANRAPPFEGTLDQLLEDA